MKKKYNKIWELAIPYLKKGIMKDFVVHTQGVVKSMELLVANEGGDEDILIPAAILHDVGFSKISKDLQTNADLSKKREAQRQHLVLAKDIIQEILEKVGYKQADIDKVVGIVEVHKFHDPKELEKQLLIDADNLSDVWSEQFYADIKAYNHTPERVYVFRTRNTYYTKTAKKIAEIEMAKRLKEVQELV